MTSEHISSAIDMTDTEATSRAADPAEIRPLERGEEAEWDRFVRESPTGTFFHLSGWKQAIEKTLGHRYIPLVATRGGRISGVFPMARVRNPLFGDCLVSVPLAVYGGICANDADSYFKLLEAGESLARRSNVKYLEMRNRFEPYATKLPCRDLYCTFTLDLSPGPEPLLRALPRDTRYAIRKSQKAGLEWTEDLSMTEFHEIYARSVHRLGTPVFPSALFHRLRDAFPGQVRIFGVRKSGKAIAGVLCFFFRDSVLPYYGGSLDGYQKDSPNNFMYWSLIAQSCGEGLREFDFGRSKRGTGSYQFKSAWSMVEVNLPYRYCLVNTDSVPQLSAIDKKFQLPVEAWKRLPFGLTKIIGPRALRWIPSV